MTPIIEALPGDRVAANVIVANLSLPEIASLCYRMALLCQAMDGCAEVDNEVFDGLMNDAARHLLDAEDICE